MLRFLKNLTIVADVFLWGIVLLVGYIFGDLTFAYICLGGAVILGVGTSAYWVMCFFIDHELKNPFKGINSKEHP